MRVHVVKIGGSLLDLPDLPQRLARWRSSHEEVHDLVVVGGGGAVDELRRKHATGELDDQAAHWSAIRVMHENTHLICEKLASTRLIDAPIRQVGPELTERLGEPGVTFFDALDFMQRVEPTAPGTKLPSGWDVTSDAIAGRLAAVLGADELHLLKSRLPTGHEFQSLEALAETGYVDRALAQLAAELPPVWCWDLRGETRARCVPRGRQPLGFHL